MTDFSLVTKMSAGGTCLLAKLRNCVFLGKSSKWNLNFQNWLKALWLGVFEPTKRLATQSAAYALHNRQGKYTLVKKNEKNVF